MKTSQRQTFPIPGSLYDLESEPYNLQPYPADFDNGDDEAARADAFDGLVVRLEEGNQALLNGGFTMFEDETEEELEEEGVQDEWMDHNRVQALYTLVR